MRLGPIYYWLIHNSPKRNLAGSNKIRPCFRHDLQQSQTDVGNMFLIMQLSIFISVPDIFFINILLIRNGTRPSSAYIIELCVDIFTPSSLLHKSRRTLSTAFPL